ncbi:MAG: SusC/RagA family TonB-linked outer membrane protein [Parapedobacter sp.]|nr:MAG: SusC/RagA family TonB-linked outer membrane protein [Parapedobacter sp.]
MKKLLLFIYLWCALINAPVFSQQRLGGTVTGADGTTLSGASVRLLVSERSTATDANGQFSLPVQGFPDTLSVSYVGYLPQMIPVNNGTSGPIGIVLKPDPNALQEVVVNTGYYQVPQERATGAFTYIGNELLNRSVSTNIFDRLEGVTNSLLFDRRNLEGEDVDGQPELRVRGLSTIEADSRPLIVVDNFPYEGDITSINPNDVESVTVLRDAAAASIWGARAGNGVIVISTKQGKYGQRARISFNTNITVGEKPDLLYSRQFLPAPTVMAIQKELFERGAYAENDRTRIPAYVELLIKQRDGLIGEDQFEVQQSSMRKNDLRKEWLEHLYQTAINEQYSLGIRGGGENYHYNFSGGYDRNRANIVGNGNTRLSLSLQNTFKVGKNLEISGSAWYSSQQSENNGLGYTTTGGLSIYERLFDVDGKPAAVNLQSYRRTYHERAEEMGLVDWMMRPIDEVRLAENLKKSAEWRLNTGIRYKILDGLDVNATYQYTMGNLAQEHYYAQEAYYVRNLVNRFTQADGQQIIPYGAIMEYFNPQQHSTHSARGQLNFNKQITDNHQIAVIGGGEISQAISYSIPGQTLYNFDRELWSANLAQDYVSSYPLRPTGSLRIPTRSNTPSKITNRYLSYFGNASYSFKEQYVLSGSVRWDGSNLLGVKTNQRGVALWSIGGSWDVSKAHFYQMEWLPYLRVRATYGSAGNIDKSQSHYPTISLSNNPITNLPYAVLMHPGNPSLRWEQVNTFNFGLDIHMLNRRLTGSIEYFNKHAKHLLGANIVGPTTGVAPGSTYKMNYANLLTTGWDVQLTSRNLMGEFQWETTLLLNQSQNRVTSYRGPEQTNIAGIIENTPVQVGKSVDLIYAIPWQGLNPQTGQPLVYLDGEVTDDYAAYYRTLTWDQLIVAGSRVPRLFGSMRNTVSWKRVEMGVLISFKTGHVFRRSSMGPGQEYSTTSPVYHMDYFRRWKQPGDELNTSVPAWAETTAPNQRNAVYTNSEALITKGDVIRLQDISLAYTLGNDAIRRLPFSRVRLYAYARNLGILWRANDYGIDPDYANAAYPASRRFSLGLQMEF